MVADQPPHTQARFTLQALQGLGDFAADPGACAGRANFRTARHLLYILLGVQ
jgi:hypothetical protein